MTAAAEAKSAREGEFFVVRTAQLPNQQGVQVSYNVYIDDDDKSMALRAKRAEHHMTKIRALGKIEFIEEQIKVTRVRMSSEMDVLEQLQNEAKSAGGVGARRMPENKKDILSKMPQQIEMTKATLVIMEDDLALQKKIAGDLA